MANVFELFIRLSIVILAIYYSWYDQEQPPIECIETEFWMKQFQIVSRNRFDLSNVSTTTAPSRQKGGYAAIFKGIRDRTTGDICLFRVSLVQDENYTSHEFFEDYIRSVLKDDESTGILVQRIDSFVLDRNGTPFHHISVYKQLQEDLQDFIHRRVHRFCVQKGDSRIIMTKLIHLVAQLHRHQIIHADLRLVNVLIAQPVEDCASSLEPMRLVLCDLSKSIMANQPLKVPWIYPQSSRRVVEFAPEGRENGPNPSTGYSLQLDVYSLGRIYEYLISFEQDISPHDIKLIESMSQSNPQKRPSIFQLENLFAQKKIAMH